MADCQWEVHLSRVFFCDGWGSDLELNRARRSDECLKASPLLLLLSC